MFSFSFRNSPFWAAVIASAANGAPLEASSRDIQARALPGVLQTDGRWIVDSAGKRVKLRCTNWAGHLDTMVPEGLDKQPLATIAQRIADEDFNCVRLTYAANMLSDSYASLAANGNTTGLVKDVFTRIATKQNVPDLLKTYDAAVALNPFIPESTPLGVFNRVVTALADHSIMVIMDNHVSAPGWCCSLTDGNGWWSDIGGSEENSIHFDTSNWVTSLELMAEWSVKHPNIIGLSLRNELRAVGDQGRDNYASWYTNMESGIRAIRSENTNVLILVGGVNYAIDLSFIDKRQLDLQKLGVADKVVYEFHSYEWSNGKTPNDCEGYKKQIGDEAGFILDPNRAYQAPLMLSEFGWNLVTYDEGEKNYIQCLTEYVASNDMDWAHWALQGSYYIKNGVIDVDETYGMLTKDWSALRNVSINYYLDPIKPQTQGP